MYGRTRLWFSLGHDNRTHLEALRKTTKIFSQSRLCLDGIYEHVPFTQWIQDPSQSNVDNLNKVRREVSRHFKNKMKAYLRDKIEELETNNKIQNIRDLYRGISDFKKWYQPRCNSVMDEKGDLVADSHGIVARRRSYFSQLFNVHGFKDVGQAEIHTAEPLVPESSASEVELTIDKLKSH